MNKGKEMAMKLRAFAKGESKADAKDIRKLAKLAEEGKYKEAEKFMNSLDTFVREGIPEEVWSYILINKTKTRQVVPFVVRLKGCKKQIGDSKEFKPGEIFKAEYEFPGDMSKEAIARAIYNAREKVIEDLIEIEYQEPKIRRVK